MLSLRDIFAGPRISSAGVYTFMSPPECSRYRLISYSLQDLEDGNLDLIVVVGNGIFGDLPECYTCVSCEFDQLVYGRDSRSWFG